MEKRGIYWYIHNTSLHRGLQKSEPLMSHFSPGSHLNPRKIYSSLPVKNSPGKWSKIMPLTSKKIRVLSTQQVPEFPDMEWNNVLTGKSVNLDAIFTRMSSTATNSKTIENLSELKLQFGANKLTKSVKTHGDWVIAWRITFRATKFIFPHHEKELKEYTKYISSYFAFLHSSTHWKVFELDKATKTG